MASSPLDTHSIDDVIPVVCPGAAVRHTGDPDARGVVVSVVDGRATVLWSVVPCPKPPAPPSYSDRWTDEQVAIASREFHVDLTDPHIIDVDVESGVGGDVALIVKREVPDDRCGHASYVFDRLDVPPWQVTVERRLAGSRIIRTTHPRRRF